MKNKILPALDLLIISISFAASTWWMSVESGSVWFYLPFFIAIKVILFMRFGLYHTILKFASLPFAVTIVKAVMLSSLVCFFLLNFPMHQEYSARFIAMDYLITVFLVGLSRFMPRYFQQTMRSNGAKRTIIYGAGEVGEEVARKLMKCSEDFRLIGFIDDNTDKRGHRIHNIPVLGTATDLSSILAKHHASELIIAISDLSGERIRNVTRECRRHNVICKIVPGFTDVLNKEVDIKDIDISDLLRRDPQDLDQNQIKRFLKNKTVLITGAAGSIGSELSRQCIQYGVKKLILLDHSEYGIYSLEEEFANSTTPIRFCLLNICHDYLLDKIMEEEKPEILFHAAAYKHVPIFEKNPAEGLTNNISGTIALAKLANKHNVLKFVLISTDKAVRPTNIMGASKRICELFVQNYNTQTTTEFLSVRFGNVLGSSGSVIPKFLDQINHGGPVTVTHPEVTRYFMLTHEAVQLVLQAASIGNGGEIFILNMGNPVRILEMAEDLIFLSGKQPYKDIDIKFVGLRPGEKLYEELLIDEAEKKTQFKNITIGKTTYIPIKTLTKNIEDLLAYAKANQVEKIVSTIKAIVPEFNHNNLPASTQSPSNVISMNQKMLSKEAPAI